MDTERFPRDLRVDYRPIQGLHANPRNARTHSPAQLRKLADSIRQFGFTNPILIDETRQVLAGHGRLEAARQLGWTEVPTISLESMTEADKRAYVIADNRIADKAGWDHELLALELQYLTELDVDFDVTITGFEMAEVDILIGDLGKPDPADELPEANPAAPVTSRPGDLYALGSHRLLCGDATQAETYTQLLGSERAQIVFTDPPYNLPIDGHVSGLGAIHHREFLMASGEMAPAEFTDFLRSVFGHLVSFSQDGAIAFICMDWRHLSEMLAAGAKTFTELKNLCVWSKTNAGMGSLYRSQHELVFVFKAGTALHINHVELGKHGRYRTNVWTYAGTNTFRHGRAEDLAAHPTVKPAALVADALLDCSRRKGLVLDPFGGSGTTLIAAERTGRRARLMELDPAYVDVTIKRWEHFTGKQAQHVESGLTWAELGVMRHPHAGGSADPQEVRHG